jgi:hypothetical protein
VKRHSPGRSRADEVRLIEVGQKVLDDPFLESPVLVDRCAVAVPETRVRIRVTG